MNRLITQIREVLVSRGSIGESTARLSAASAATEAHSITTKVTLDQLEDMQQAALECVHSETGKALIRRGCQPGRYLLYQDPDYGFVIMLFVWEPGQESSIHDHGTWGIEAVLANTVKVTNYDLAPEPVARDAVFLGPGSVGAIHPQGNDIHKVTNPSKELAVTLHIYGREMSEHRYYEPGKGFRCCKLTCKELPLPPEELPANKRA